MCGTVSEARRSHPHLHPHTPHTAIARQLHHHLRTIIPWPFHQAYQQLQGRQVPGHLLGNPPEPPILELSFSAHTDLAITVQSTCTRCASAASASRSHTAIPTAAADAAAALSACCRCPLPLRRCSDYANGTLPWGEPDWGMLQSLLQGAAAAEVPPSNVLAVAFDNATYPVTLDGLHTVRKACVRPLPQPKLPSN